MMDQPSADDHGRLTKQLVVRIDETLYRVLVVLAREQNTTVGAIVRPVLRERFL